MEHSDLLKRRLVSYRHASPSGLTESLREDCLLRELFGVELPPPAPGHEDGRVADRAAADAHGHEERVGRDDGPREDRARLPVALAFFDTSLTFLSGLRSNATPVGRKFAGRNTAGATPPRDMGLGTPRTVSLTCYDGVNQRL